MPLRRVLLGGGGAPGGINFRGVVDAALSLRSLLSGVMARTIPAIGISRHVLTVVTLERPALALSTVNSGIAAKPAVDPGLLLTMRSTGTIARPAAVSGMSVVRTSVALTHRAGANAVVETAVAARTDWASDANAIGRDNGTLATFAGNALGARGGQLEFDYADPVGKDALTISAVRLHFYVRTAGTVVNNADVQLRYDIGAGFVTTITIVANLDALTAPQTVDLFALGVNTWAEVAAIRSAVRAESAIAELWTADCDAVELEVVAESIVTP